MSPSQRGVPRTLAKESRFNIYLWYGSENKKRTEYVLREHSKTAGAVDATLDKTGRANSDPGDKART
jgi:hypothetical protein